MEDFPEFFLAIGNALLENKMFDEALDCFMELAENEEVSSSLLLSSQ